MPTSNLYDNSVQHSHYTTVSFEFLRHDCGCHSIQGLWVVVKAPHEVTIFLQLVFSNFADEGIITEQFKSISLPGG